MLELIIIVVYFIGMISVGIYSRRKARQADDFFVAGRKSSSLFITGSLLATIIGGSAIMVTGSLGFSRGFTGVWFLLVGSIGLVILGIFLAKKVREFGLYTLPELVEKQYDRRVGLAASILIVVAWIGVIGAQIIADLAVDIAGHAARAPHFTTEHHDIPYDVRARNAELGVDRIGIFGRAYQFELGLSDVAHDTRQRPIVGLIENPDIHGIARIIPLEIRVVVILIARSRNPVYAKAV